MAAVTAFERMSVRAAAPGEGAMIAGLWRELWEAHERWGGYASARDPRVFDRIGVRLDEDARVRGGHPVLGRHIHLIAAFNEGRLRNPEVVGQVEGWFERHGIEAQTPFTCEVRSLIVGERARGLGAGRALLEALAGHAASLTRNGPAVMAAEVLEPNPAHAFYERLGYAPVAWSARMSTSQGLVPTALHARVAEPGDALAIGMLESQLAARRRVSGDLRFDRPRAIDATFVGSISTHLARSYRDPGEPVELVTVDAKGHVRAAASVAVAPLDPPFAPTKRSLLGRFAIDPAGDPHALVAPLIALACRIAASRDAPTMELTDLTAPNTGLYRAALALGARPWSRIVTKLVQGPAAP
jgi:GNAT superfamily N-acetyltransferase